MNNKIESKILIVLPSMFPATKYKKYVRSVMKKFRSKRSVEVLRSTSLKHSLTLPTTHCSNSCYLRSKSEITNRQTRRYVNCILISNISSGKC